MNAFPNGLCTRPTYSSSTERLAEPFIDQMFEVFKQLELLVPKGNEPTHGPSGDTIEWAKKILLRVLPREFLIGAQVSAFQREIHVTWENDETGKRVVVFFPGQQQLKIYHESVANDEVVEHRLVNATSPSDVSDRLRWYRQ